MQATLTDLRRGKANLVRRVIHGKEVLELTAHGRVVAEVRPKASGMDAREFSRLWRNRSPLGRDAAKIIAASMRKTREASCVS
jgi:antitoxin (DNA-binding transcriptional repressor) of toxin-antitoxin stability system